MEADLEKLKHTGEFAVFVSPGVDIYISIRIRVNSPSKALSMVLSGGSIKEVMDFMKAKKWIDRSDEDNNVETEAQIEGEDFTDYFTI